MGHEEVPIAFFSYCREDSEFALKLAADLKDAGAQVWIDQLDIEPGTPWDRAVEDALTNSPRMLVVLSPVSVNSDNVRDEVSFALSRQKRVIPVLYRDCDVPFRLARLQHIDFRPDYAKALGILLRALGVGQAAHEQVSSGAIASATEAPGSTAQPEQQTTEAEERAGHEHSRREQRAAEQAQLAEEARLAAERVRLAQVEKERREAEIKARQEQLRREEQESVERKSLNLDAEPQAKREPTFREILPGKASPSRPPEQANPAVELRRPAAEAHAAPLPTASPLERVPSPQTRPAAGRNLASPKYLVGGAVLVAVLGLVIFMLAHRNGPQKPPDNAAAESKSAEAAPVHPAPVQNPPPGSTSRPPSSDAAVSVSKQDQAKGSGTPAPNNNGLATANLARPQSDLSNPNVSAGQLSAAKAATSTPANVSAAPNRVRISQGVSHGMLMYEVAPAYPPLARSARIQGQVVLDVIIGKDGGVQSIKAESGHPMLVPAAIDAVKKWRYKPYKLDGKPVEVDTQVMVNFTLTN